MTCTHCTASVHDGTTLCAKCVKTLDVALGNIPPLTADMDSARTRGASTGRGVPGSKPPPGFDLGPEEGTQLSDDVRNELIGWVRITIDTWPNLTWPSDTVQGMCGHVQGILTAIAGQPWAHELLREMLALEHRLKRITDPEPWIYAGTCFVCGVVSQRVPLYARSGDRWVRCPSEDCGMRYDVTARREAMVADMEDKLCTAAEIASLATYLDLLDDRERVRNRINQWHRRNVIEPSQLNPDGEPMFSFGEVVARIKEADVERRAELMRRESQRRTA